MYTDGGLSWPVLRKFFALFLPFFVGFSPSASAHLSLLLHEAIGASGETTSAGHAAVYLSNVCGNEAAGLRQCRPGEPGIVIASYPQFGLAKDFEWMAVSLPYYLYGLPQDAEIPLYANGKVRTLLRNAYGDEFLQSAIDDSAPPKTRWNQMIGVVYNRDVYAFTVVTTKDEDQRFIDAFNARPNVSHFSTTYNNCADFAMRVINTYFPHSVHRDYLNDFTMATPKTVAREITLRFAFKHPERQLTIQKFSQVQGPIKRSFDNRNFTEQAFHSKKFLITEAALNQELLGVFVASYYLTAHFDVNFQYKHRVTRDLFNMQSVDELPPPLFLDAAFLDLPSPEASATFAPKQTWQAYRAAFKPMLDQAIADGYFVNQREVRTFFRDLERQSDPELASDGLRLRVHSHGVESTVGLLPSNILAPDSDRKIAYKLLLALVRADLTSPEKNRSPFDKFEDNWDLLQQAAQENANPVPPQIFLENPVHLSMKKRLLRDFLFITH